MAECAPQRTGQCYSYFIVVVAGSGGAPASGVAEDSEVGRVAREAVASAIASEAVVGTRLASALLDIQDESVWTTGIAKMVSSQGEALQAGPAVST